MAKTSYLLESLLRYFSAEERSIPSTPEYPGRCEECVRALNGAMEEIHSASASSYAHAERGYLFMAPVTADLTVTKGSRTATILPPASEDPTLCLIGADNRLVRVAQVTGPDDDTPSILNIQLFDQWTGSSGTYSATLYRDATPLGSDVLQLAGKPALATSAELDVFQTEGGAAQGAKHEINDFGSTPRVMTGWSRKTGTPEACWVATVWNPVNRDYYGGTATKYLVLSPAPIADTEIRANVTLSPPRIDPSNIDLDQEIPISNDWVDSMLLPIASQRLQACSFFRNDSVLGEITRQFNLAMEKLSSMRGSKISRTIFNPGP